MKNKLIIPLSISTALRAVFAIVFGIKAYNNTSPSYLVVLNENAKVSTYNIKSNMGKQNLEQNKGVGGLVGIVKEIFSSSAIAVTENSEGCV